MPDQNVIRSKRIRLNAAVAIEDGAKRREYADLTQLYKTIQKSDLFSGMTKEWTKTRDDAPERDTERRIPKQNAIDIIKGVIENFGNRLSVTATKDYGNTEAKADVVMEDGTVLISNVPVTHLIFMRKQLDDLRAFISKLPTLDTARQWKFDPNGNSFRAVHSETQVSTQKTTEVIQLTAATKDHPETAQLITVDKPVGKYTTNYQSTALPSKTIKHWLGRINDLERAVNLAREEANSIEVDRKDTGSILLKHIFEGIENDGAEI